MLKNPLEEGILVEMTAQVAAVSSPRSELAEAANPDPGKSSVLVPSLVLVLAIVFLFHRVLGKLVHDWFDDPNYSHGIFIPLFSGFVVWSRRRELAVLSPRGTWWGVAVCLGALALLIVAVLGAELFLARVAFLFFIAGSILALGGTEVFRKLLFPWAVLLLMIPMPAIIFNQITFPLQILASKLATGLLSLCGVPVLRDGNLLQLPTINLEVATACSGLRSLVSLASLAMIFGYLNKSRPWHIWALIGFSIPIAVFANSIRIMGTGLLAQYWDPDKAEGFFHAFEGWLIFIVSLLFLFGVDRLLRWCVKRWKAAA